MAGKKPAINNKLKTKKKPVPKASSGSFFRLLIKTPIRQLIMIAVIVAILAAFWSTIEDATGRLIDFFGWCSFLSLF
jgi:hypothetical protein